MDYPEVLDYSPLHVDAAKLHKLCQRFGAYADAVEKVGLAIAGYANQNGESFPSLKLIARLTGFTIQEVSRYAHWLQAAGFLVIRKVKAAGARYAHNVYKIAKSFIHRTADVTSAHFIGNLQKWKAKASDVAAAVKEKARAAVDTVVEQAAKMAALFQDRPELMESPAQAAALAGIETSEIAEEPVTVEIPAVSETVAAASTMPAQPVGDAMPAQPAPPSCYQRTAAHVYSSWRDRVPAAA